MDLGRRLVVEGHDLLFIRLSYKGLTPNCYPYTGVKFLEVECPEQCPNMGSEKKKEKLSKSVCLFLLFRLWGERLQNTQRHDFCRTVFDKTRYVKFYYSFGCGRRPTWLVLRLFIVTRVCVSPLGEVPKYRKPSTTTSRKKDSLVTDVTAKRSDLHRSGSKLLSGVTVIKSVLPLRVRTRSKTWLTHNSSINTLWRRYTNDTFRHPSFVIYDILY